MDTTCTSMAVFRGSSECTEVRDRVTCFGQDPTHCAHSFHATLSSGQCHLTLSLGLSWHPPADSIYGHLLWLEDQTFMSPQYSGRYSLIISDDNFFIHVFKPQWQKNMITEWRRHPKWLCESTPTFQGTVFRVEMWHVKGFINVLDT